MEDTSLDQFADAAVADDESAEAETAASADTGAVDDSSDGPETPTAPADDPAEDAPADVDPTVSTATWTPGGSDCDVCGSAVERRWADDGALVCADCKDW